MQFDVTPFGCSWDPRSRCWDNKFVSQWHKSILLSFSNTQLSKLCNPPQVAQKILIIQKPQVTKSIGVAWTCTYVADKDCSIKLLTKLLKKLKILVNLPVRKGCASAQREVWKTFWSTRPKKKRDILHPVLQQLVNMGACERAEGSSMGTF